MDGENQEGVLKAPGEPASRKETGPRERATEKFFNNLFELEGRFEEVSHREILKGNASAVVNFLSLPTNDKLWQPISEFLGIVGGAYGLAHRRGKEFHLFQNPAVYPQAERNLPAPYIRYRLPGEEKDCLKEFANLIDLLFIGRRRAQPMLGSRSNPPEFFKSLPPQGREEQVLPWLPHEKWLRRKLPSGHYRVHCSAGEIAFCLLAWRRLMLQSQSDGDLSVPANPAAPVTNPSSAQEFWRAREFSDGARDGDSVESAWLRTIDSCSNPPDPCPEEELDFLNRALLEWRDARRRAVDDVLQPGKEYDFRTDWCNLGLLARGVEGYCATRSLLSLIRYCLNIHAYLKRQRDVSAPQPCGINGGGIEDSLGILEEAEKKLSTWVKSSPKEADDIPSELPDASDVRLEEIGGGRLNRAILLLVHPVLLTARSDAASTAEPSATIGSLLSALHDRARFPIIPYWYICTLSKRIVEHVVVPVWRSHSFMAQFIPGPSNGWNPMKPVSACGVVYCLLSILPGFSRHTGGPLTRGAEHGRKSRLTREAKQRFIRIERLFVRLAGPLIDSGFYSAHVGDEIRVGARQNLTHELAEPLDAALRLQRRGRSTQTRIIRAALNYARLILPGTGRALGSASSLNQWAKECIPLAWEVTIAKQIADLYENADIKMVGELLATPPAVAVKGGEQLQIVGDPEGPKEATLAPALDRWLLAALNNALRWCAPLHPAGHGHVVLLRHWHKTKSYKPVVVRFEEESNGVAINVANAAYGISESDGDKIGGTASVLREIALDMPESSETQRFGPIDEKILDGFGIANETAGWLARIKLSWTSFMKPR